MNTRTEKGLIESGFKDCLPVSARLADILVINLLSRSDRRDLMEDRLQELNLNYRLIEAVNASDLKVKVDMGLPIGRFTGRRRSRPDYAAFSSHRVCWKQMIDNNISVALILEDDVLLADDFHDIARLDWIPDDADIVKLETTKRYVEVHRRRFEPAVNRRLGLLASKHMGAAGYIIKLHAAARLWEATATPQDGIDHVLFRPESWREHGLKIYQVDPAPVMQGMYDGKTAGLEWANSDLQPSRDARGFKMDVGDFRLYGRKEGNLFSRTVRPRTALRAIRALKCLARKGAYKRIQFG